MSRASLWWFLNPLEWLKFLYETIGAKHPTGSLVGVMIACALIGAVLWKVGALQYEKSHTDSIPIFLNCESVSPPIPFPANSTITVLEISASISGFSEVTSSAVDPEGFWPDKHEAPETMFRCRLVNDGGDPIFAAAAVFRVIFKEALQVKGASGNAQVSGRTALSHDRKVTIPRVEGHGGAFVFYVRNRSSQFADVRVPEHIVFEPSKGSDSVAREAKAFYT